MKTKILTTTIFILLAGLTLTGCSWILGSGPIATIKAFHARAESNNPEAMCKLYSTGYLEKNKKSLEGCRSFADLAQKILAAGETPSLFDLSETYVGEKAIVKGRYGSTKGGGSLPFQARLVKENGDWKIEVFGGIEEDLSKEEPKIERSKELVREVDTDGRPRRLIFSPDGKTLAYTAEINEAGKKELSIQLIDVQTGNSKGKIPVVAEYSVGSLRFSSDGKMIAATDGDKNIYIWDAVNLGSPQQTIAFNDSDKYDAPVGLAFAPNGDLYGGGSKGSLLIYDSKNGNLKQKLEGHPISPRPAAPASKTAVPPPPGSGWQINEIVFSNDGKLFATIAQNEVKVWDATTGKALKKFSLPAEVINGITETNSISAAFASDVKSLLTYSQNGLLQSWNLQTGEPTTIKKLEKLYVASAEYSRDGKWLTDSGGKSDDPPRGVRIYNAQTGELKVAFTGHRGPARAVFSPDGKLAASTSENDYSKIFLWDTSGISQ